MLRNYRNPFIYLISSIFAVLLSFYLIGNISPVQAQSIPYCENKTFISSYCPKTPLCQTALFNADCTNPSVICRLFGGCELFTGDYCCSQPQVIPGGICTDITSLEGGSLFPGTCTEPGTYLGITCKEPACFITPTLPPPPTSTPTPISCVQIPGAFAYNQCTSCNQSTDYYYNCDGSVYSFGSQLDSSCNSLCTLTPTPTAGPTPTPTPTPFSCTGAIGDYNYSCSTDASCTGGFISGYNPNTTCSSQGQTCCFFPSSIPTVTPFPTSTPTPIPTPTPICPVGSTYAISGTVTKSGGQNPGKILTLCLDPVTSGTCAGAPRITYTYSDGSYSFSNVLSGISHNVFLDPSSLPTSYSVVPPNPALVTCTNTTANFTISTVPTPTPTPTPIGPTPTPAPTSVPTPTSSPGGWCNYISPPQDSPTVMLAPDGHTLNITYSLGAVSNPSVTFYRNTSPGFYETSSASATLLAAQFGNKGSTLHTNLQYPINAGGGNYYNYYNYQIVKESGGATSYSNSYSLLAQKPNTSGQCYSYPYGYNPGTISGAGQVYSTDTSFTFDLSYYVYSYFFWGCGATCYPSVLPPYLRIYRSSSHTTSYIPFNSYTSLTSTCTNWWRWFGNCTTTVWKARYTLSLPPGTLEGLGISTFGTNTNYCGMDNLIGSASFTAGTQEGPAITPGTDPTFSASGPSSGDENGGGASYVSLGWSPTQYGIDAKVYYREGPLNRWPLTTQLGYKTPVWNGSTWTFTTTDDLRTLPSGTYYYGAIVYYANVCAGGTVQTDQTAYAWGGKFYTVSGDVFVDKNKNKLKDPGEQNYKGQVTISAQGNITYPINGGYKIFDLPEGTYTISYTSLPTGYQVSYPVNGPPPSFTITVGDSCSVGSSNSASCIGQGDIKDLNFGISNLTPWIQSVGLDLRIDSGFNDDIPSAALQPYASILGSGGTPGIIFSGGNSYDFGQGQASPNPYNWIAGGPIYPEIFVPKQPGVIQTSYAYQIATAQQNGLTPTDIETFCTGGIASCTLSSTLPHDLYLANGNLTINPSYAFGGNQNYIILVNGDLTINGNITVPNGSTVTFSVSGNIYIDKSVTNIEGYYSADQSFTAKGTNDCSLASDVQLKIKGSVVVNAGQNGGTFQNQRDLCANDTTTPAVQFIERPDFIINAPQLIQFSRPIWQEVAP